MIDFRDEDFRKRLLTAIKNNKLILFVGAGFSKLCGLPLWYDLAVRLIDFCVSSDNYVFCAKDKELLLSSVKDSRELVTIASNIIGKNNKDAFYSKICELLKVDKNRLNKTEKQNYERLPKIIKNLANTIVTTNADLIIDEQFDDKSAVLYKKDDIKKFHLKDDKQVFHIHGSIEEPSEMIFSTVDYLNRYNTKEFSSRIQELFNSPDPERIILIIGYSLSEIQLLDLVVKNEVLPSVEREKKTYLLNGYYSYQENVFKAEQEYYKTYGITLLSYSKDIKGYQGLADALIDLQEYVNKNSTKASNQTQKVLNLFKSKPTNKTFCSFLNEFSEFDNKRRNYCLGELKKSEYVYNWVKKFFENDVFFNKYLNLESNLDSILEDEYGFSCCRFVTELTLSNAKNKEAIKDYFRKLILSFIEQKKFFQNRTMALKICKAIMSNVEYISMPEAYYFIELFETQEYRDYWILYLCYENDILQKVNKGILIKYATLALNSFYLNGDENYYFSLFYDKYGYSLYTKVPKEIIKVCEEITYKEIKKNESHFITRDTFEEIEKNENEFYPVIKIYKVFLLCLNGLNGQDVFSYYKTYRSKKKIFYKQLSIYLASQKYDVLEQLLFNDLKKYSKDRNYYAEIYSCFRKNENNISNGKISKLLHFIKSIKFEDYSEIWNITAKKYLLELFANNKKFVDLDEYKLLCQEVDNLIEHDKLQESIKSMPSPQNMSKSMRSSVSSWSKDKTLYNELKDLNDSELFQRLKLVNLKDHDKVDNIYDLLKLRMPKGFLKFLIENELFSEMQTGLAEIILRCLLILDKIESVNILETIIKIVNSRTIKGDNEKLKRLSFETIYFVIKRITNNKVSELTLENVFEYVFDTDFWLDDDWQVKSKNPSSNINLLFSSNVFEWLNILLLSCSTKGWDKLKNKFISWSNDEYKLTILKAALVANIHLVWILDENFVRSHISSLFDNYNNEINYSCISFQLSMYYNPKFVNLLAEQKLLFNLIQNKDFGLNRNYLYIIIRLYFNGDIDIKIVRELIKCDCSKSSIHLIIDEFKKYDVTKLSKNVISDFFLIIAETEFEGMDLSALNLYKLSKTFLTYDHYVDAIVSLLRLKNHAQYASDLLSCLKDSCLNETDNEKIIYVYLMNLKDHYFYVDDILRLINETKWSKESTKNQIINKLGQLNPVFLAKSIDYK